MRKLPVELDVLQVNYAAMGGGAERVALSLHRGYQRRGIRSWMAVADRNVDDPDIFAIPRLPSRAPGWQALRAGSRRLAPIARHSPATARMARAIEATSSPTELLHLWQGREHFGYPGSRRILDLPPQRPRIVHCHNLHGGYFDLRSMAPLSRTVPVVMTLHDEWTFTGHCAYTLGCERWRTGCGSCPDLTIYPAIRRDATDANWRVKRDIYARSDLFVTTPSQWLMDRARDSILADAVRGWRVIPNGVDRSIFRPADRVAARERLNLPQESLTLLFAATQARTNMFKDYPTVLAAAHHAAVMLTNETLLLIVLGDSGPAERFGNLEVRYVPYEADLTRVAGYYQAADIYLHGARTETAGLTVLEALASGLPVIATAVGGIVESVRSLAGAPGAWKDAAHPADRATGVLVAPADAEGMGAATASLLGDESLRLALSANAAADAANRFDLERQIDDTLTWYQDILSEWPGGPGAARQPV